MKSITKLIVKYTIAQMLFALAVALWCSSLAALPGLWVVPVASVIFCFSNMVNSSYISQLSMTQQHEEFKRVFQYSIQQFVEDNQLQDYPDWWQKSSYDLVVRLQIATVEQVKARYEQCKPYFVAVEHDQLMGEAK